MKPTILYKYSSISNIVLDILHLNITCRNNLHTSGLSEPQWRIGRVAEQAQALAVKPCDLILTPRPQFVKKKTNSSMLSSGSHILLYILWDA